MTAAPPPPDIGGDSQSAREKALRDAVRCCEDAGGRAAGEWGMAGTAGADMAKDAILALLATPTEGEAENPSDVARDAARYRFLRAAPVDGTSGRPVIAVPSGPWIGIYVSEADADAWLDAAMIATPGEGGADSPSNPHFIRRHGAFFRPNRSGYCTEIAGAGIYSAAEARTYLDVEGVTIHPVGAYAREIALVLEGADRLRAAMAATPAEDQP